MRFSRFSCFVLLTVFISALFSLRFDPSQARAVPASQSIRDDAPTASAASPAQRPANWTFDEWIKDAPPELSAQFAPLHPAPYPVQLQPGSYLDQDWAAMIDSVWGPGLSYSQHISIWQYMWDDVDTSFASFWGLDPGIWDTVWNRYWPEIQDTVSKGRLASIIQRAHLPLKEMHANMFDQDVFSTAPEPGVPLLGFSGWGTNDHFGAALTPLPDSSLLVYKAVASHPLGLVPGDIVLGYDGVPWKNIYPYLVDTVELPLGGEPAGPRGNTEASSSHAFLMAAGKNWHLFDSIDVVKYNTGDTLRLSTSVLIGQSMSLWATEQMDIPGVPMPDLSAGDVTSWGIIDGTNIGYIYSLGWIPYADSALIVNEWLRALDSLQNVYGVCGLIIDIRTNFGSNFDFTKIHDYFFNDTLDLVGFDKRVSGGGHFDMEPGTGLTIPVESTINGDPNTYWDTPIAILTGPGAGSGGDVFPLLLSYHPVTKVFGETSKSAFSSTRGRTPFTGWHQGRNLGIAYLASDSGNYINRKPFPNPVDFPWVDFQEVWLTQDGVVNGRDDVVDSAMAWIESLDGDCDGVLNGSDNCPMTYNPAQEDLDSNGVGDSCECNVVVIDNTGDVNVDGVITSADIIALVNYVFKGGPAPLPCEASGDVNCNGSVTSADIIYLVGYVFKGGAAPCDVCSMIPGTWTCP